MFLLDSPAELHEMLASITIGDRLLSTKLSLYKAKNDLSRIRTRTLAPLKSSSRYANQSGEQERTECF